MKQKYLITKNDFNTEYYIKELSELEKENYGLIAEESYDVESLSNAINQGKESTINRIRTLNFYPPFHCAEKIADAIIELFKSESQKLSEVFIDDGELIARYREILGIEAEIKETIGAALYEDEAAPEFDEILAGEIDEENYVEPDEISDISPSSPLSTKIADEDALDVDGEE
ncbi:MAG: hypothetical protein HQK76_00575 [Desulfobacterales bacterium]|nr:hypothetical protein [Desulfobacterales bacterium]